MKKILAVILVVVIVFSFAGCNTAPKPIEPIELTKDNIKNYLAIGGEYSDTYFFSAAGKLGTMYTTVNLNTYGISAGAFNNVSITLRPFLSSGTGHWTRLDESSISITFELPSSGSYSTSYDIQWYNDDIFADLTRPEGAIQWRIHDVSGTFIPAQ